MQRRYHGIGPWSTSLALYRTGRTSGWSVSLTYSKTSNPVHCSTCVTPGVRCRGQWHSVSGKGAACSPLGEMRPRPPLAPG